ncbi:ATP-binding protein [Xanthomonas campestris pv. phormiicola]|nr:ATP-binding protein [Xanthomonas campestris pv. phormiicola]UYC17456.1 ATP-binding protein [Xanthomonas campestris pv. phormiicola]
MSTIRLKTNQHRLIANLRHAFNQASMLGELLQNARRAQANHIHITVDNDTLTVSDDGIGIADLQTLIFIAESGWDDELIVRENAFGLGVLSTLYFAQHLSVHSVDQAFQAETASIIRGSDVEVIPAPLRIGTQIRLNGVASPQTGMNLPDWVRRELARLCEAFPVPVSLNGVAIARPLADPSLKWRQTTMGQVLLSLSAPRTEWRCFLQGLPIGTRPRLNDHQVVLLRDNLIARPPDRQHLLNETEDNKRIQAAIDQAYREALIEAKANLSGSEFVERHGSDCLRSSNADLLNDVPFAQRSWFRNWADEPPGYRRFWERYLLGGIVAKEALEEAGVWQVGEDATDEHAAHVYLEVREAFLLEEAYLDPGHWLSGMVKTIEPSRIVIKQGAILHEDANLPLADYPPLVLKLVDTLSVYLDGEPGVYTVETVRQGETLYLTSGADQVTRFVSDYIFNDRYDENSEAEDAATIATFIAVGRSPDPAGVVSALLPTSLRHSPLPRLAGATVCLVFDGEGRLQEVSS